ncbi:hypothetical protein INR49_020699 [Caranx melampygus]|nr:hypothetical protein INR49_020699 [Caranx melampygus]
MSGSGSELKRICGPGGLEKLLLAQFTWVSAALWDTRELTCSPVHLFTRSEDQTRQREREERDEVSIEETRQHVSMTRCSWCPQCVSQCVVMSESGGDGGRWLDAHYDPVPVSHLVVVCGPGRPERGRGESEVLGDLGSGSSGMKLKVYRGTALVSESTLLDLPAGLVAFFMDLHEPRILLLPWRPDLCVRLQEPEGRTSSSAAWAGGQRARAGCVAAGEEGQIDP